MNKNRLSQIFNTLSNPVRLAIFECILSEACECDLSRDELSGNCVSRISQKLKINQPTVSNHIKELLNHGIVTSEKKGRKIFLFGTEESVEAISSFGIFANKKVKAAQTSCLKK